MLELVLSERLAIQRYLALVPVDVYDLLGLIFQKNFI